MVVHESGENRQSTASNVHIHVKVASSSLHQLCARSIHFLVTSAYSLGRALTNLRISDSLSPTTTRALLQSTTYCAVSHPCTPFLSHHFSSVYTYHWALEASWVGLQLSQSIGLVFSTGDQAADLGSSTKVFQDALELVLCRWLLGHLELKVTTLGRGGSILTAGLILGCVRGGFGRSLLEESVNAEGSWSGGLVEEGDHIEGFVL